MFGRKSSLNLSGKMTEVQSLLKRNVELAKALNKEKHKSSELQIRLNAAMKWQTNFTATNAIDDMCKEMLKYGSEAMSLINACVSAGVEATTAITKVLEISRTIQRGSNQNGKVQNLMSNLNSSNISPSRASCNNSNNNTRAVRPMVCGHQISFPTVKIYRAEADGLQARQGNAEEDVESENIEQDEEVEAESESIYTASTSDFDNVTRRKPQECIISPLTETASIESSLDAPEEEFQHLSTVLEVTENISVARNNATTSLSESAETAETHSEIVKSLTPLPVISEYNASRYTPESAIPSSTPFSDATVENLLRLPNNASQNEAGTPKRFVYERRNIKPFSNRISIIQPCVILKRIQPSKCEQKEENDAIVPASPVRNTKAPNASNSSRHSDEAETIIVHQPTQRRKRAVRESPNDLPLLYDGPCTSSFVMKRSRTDNTKTSNASPHISFGSCKPLYNDSDSDITSDDEIAAVPRRGAYRLNSPTVTGRSPFKVSMGNASSKSLEHLRKGRRNSMRNKSTSNQIVKQKKSPSTINKTSSSRDTHTFYEHSGLKSVVDDSAVRGKDSIGVDRSAAATERFSNASAGNSSTVERLRKGTTVRARKTSAKNKKSTPNAFNKTAKKSVSMIDETASHSNAHTFSEPSGSAGESSSRDGGPVRRSNRSRAVVNLKEPSLNSKMRRKK